MCEKDPELRKEVRINFTVTGDTIILKIGLLTTRSLKIKKIMVWIILAKEIWIKQIKEPTSDNLEKLMNLELLEKAANSVVKIVQLKSFGEEMQILKCKLKQQNWSQ